jgi:hypothetical protein
MDAEVLTDREARMERDTAFCAPCTGNTAKIRRISGALFLKNTGRRE